MQDGSSTSTEKKVIRGKSGMAETMGDRTKIAHGVRNHMQKMETVTISASILSACKWWVVLVCLSMSMGFLCWQLSWKLPAPKSAEQAGPMEFAEERAMIHLEAMVGMGPRLLGTKTLDSAVEYVMEELRKVQRESAPGVVVDLDLQKVEPAGMRLHSGMFVGRAHTYAGMSNVVCRIRGESWVDGPESHSILVSSHLDTVGESPGAGDDSSPVATMMEVLRALGNHPPAKHAVVFLFNSGEESGLLGAHAFITQHPWRFSVRAAIDLEAMGVGGRSVLFQAGPDGWLLRKFAEVAPYPDAQIVPQDVFQRGIIKSATDFQVYTEVADLPSLDFAYMEYPAVYHTKHDSLKLYRAGSLQHSGDNLVAFLRSVTSSDEFEQQRNVSWKTDTKDERPVYVSVGSTLFILSIASAHRLYQSGIIASLFLLFIAPLFRHALTGKSDAVYPDASHYATWKLGLHILTALALSLLTVMFTVVGTVISAAASAFLVSHPGFSYHSMPYVAHPWLVIGLFAAPALAGGLIAHKAGQVILLKYLKWIGICQDGAVIMSEVERLLYKGGVLLWMVILVVADRNSLGSSIFAFVLMMAPMLTYLLLEGDGESWTANGPRTGLRWCTAVLALAVPLLVTSMAAIRLPAFLVGTFTSMDRNPGGAPLFMPSLFISILVALLVSTFLVYLFPYAHRQGATRWVIGFSLFIMAASFFTVHQRILPPFSDTLTRKVNVIHYFDADRSAGFVTFFSLTPGSLDEEVKMMNVEGLSCKKDMLIDFVHFNVTYACTKETDYRAQPFEDSSLRAPKLELLPNGGASSSSRRREDEPMHVLINAGGSMRWAIAINSDIVANYSLATHSGRNDDERGLGWDGAQHGKVMLHQAVTEETVPRWHIVNFVSAVDGPSLFTLTLHPCNACQYSKSELGADASSHGGVGGGKRDGEGSLGDESEGEARLKNAPGDRAHGQQPAGGRLLLRMIADHVLETREVAEVSVKLPPWTAKFGKSSMPLNVAFFRSLSIS